VERVQEVFAAFNRRDQETFMSGFDPDVEFLPYGENTPHRGLYRLRTWWEDLLEAFPDWQMRPLEVRDLGDTVLVANRNQGHGGGSGVVLDATVWTAVRIRNGKAIWWGSFATEGEALEAVGGLE
jgi:ketosteroid isomerase-like protein